MSGWYSPVNLPWRVALKRILVEPRYVSTSTTPAPPTSSTSASTRRESRVPGQEVELNCWIASNLGKYRFEVVDVATNQVLYSRGFASIFGEWETTGEAIDGIVKTIPEAIRFPEPRDPVQVRILQARG